MLLVEETHGQQQHMARKDVVSLNPARRARQRPAQSALQKAIATGRKRRRIRFLWDQESQVPVLHAAMKKVISEAIPSGVIMHMTKGKERLNKETAYYEYPCDLTIGRKVYKTIIKSPGQSNDEYKPFRDIMELRHTDDDGFEHIFDVYAHMIRTPRGPAKWQVLWGESDMWIIEKRDDPTFIYARSDNNTYYFNDWIGEHHPEYKPGQNVAILPGRHKPFSGEEVGPLSRPAGLPRRNWASQPKARREDPK
ncbi:MAG: hypothetical protein AB7G06_06415 [Bdellovibrionales bacterium]